MADFLIQAILSNLVVATILAVIAWVVQQRVRSASLANLLWAIVLIKLVTPPIFSLPVLEVPRISNVSTQSTGLPNEAPGDAIATGLVTEVPLSVATESTRSDAPPHLVSSDLWLHIFRLAICLWITVSAILIVVSAFRILRFHSLLKANSRAHQDLSFRLCAQIASQMGVRRYPNIFVSSANVAPFVWWMAGRPIIVVSEQAIQQLSDEDLRLVISHEVAHIKRRDHWFRWLEWTALTWFWWNPVMWWARTQLRNSEEIACDNLVLELTNPDIHQYAHSLLNMAELLTATAIRPPIVASAINSGGNLEKRLKLMIANKTREIPTWLRGVICAGVMCVLPVGLVYAQDFDAVERRLGGAVEAGELSLEQARVMMEALKSSARSKHHYHDIEARKQRYMAIAEEIEAAVKAGKLSKEDAEKKLVAIRTEMFRNPGDKKKEAGSARDTDREMEARKQRYMAIAKEIEAAVKAGKLSKEDAEKKLVAIRTEMFRNPGDKKKEARSARDTDREMEARKQRYMAIAEEIEAAVKAGKLSKEDAEKKLVAIRTEMFRNPGDKKKEAGSARDTDREMEARKQRYMAIVKEIEAAVKAGKLSKEDAEKKLVAIRTELFRNPGDKKKEAVSTRDTDRDMEARKQRYMAIAKEIEAAVKTGRLSKRDAEKQLIEMRLKMFEGKSGDERSREMEAGKKRFEQVTKRIKAAIESGDISAEEGRKKLLELRKESFDRGN